MKKEGRMGQKLGYWGGFPKEVLKAHKPMEFLDHDDEKTIVLSRKEER
jgi:hypothetical protein